MAEQKKVDWATEEGATAVSPGATIGGPSAQRTGDAQMELLSDTLHLRAEGVAAFASRGLVFAPGVTESELLGVGRRLFAVRSYTKWALGSVFAAMVQAREKRREVSDRARKDDATGAEWAAEFAGAHHLDPKEYREMLGVYTFYHTGAENTKAGGVGVGTLVGADGELAGLDFEHFREAMWGVDDGAPDQRTRALAYLRTAHVGGMTVTQLRRHIRTSAATQTVEPAQTELAAYGWVFDARRWCEREMDKVHRYTPERASLILSDMGESMLSYIDALRDIAGGGKPTKTTPRQKESFTNGKPR